jgi:multidrug efflux pump subunit AcrA (membrane-fusion protein)
MKNIFKSFFILPIILLLAVAFVVFQVKSKSPIAHQPATYPVKVVEVITAQKIPFRARAMAFGHVEPATELKAKAEVSGKIIYLHPHLKKGASVPKDTVVLQIEPTSFEISLDQSKAGLAGSESSLAQLQTEERSSRKALAIAQQNLNVGLAELARIEALVEKNLVTQSSVDKETQKVLSLRQQVQDIRGKLESFASRKAATEAQIKQSQSQVNQSQDTLGRTEISLPFDARIGAVSVEAGEFVPAGSILFEALGVQAVEINAELPSTQFRPLVAGLTSDVEGESTINLQNPNNFSTVLSKLGLEARVRLVGDLSGASVWQGELIRVSESVDPNRDTLGLTIEVKNPYQGIIPGQRPPLLKGMYTSVALYAPQQPMLILPRKALHQGRVYVAADDNTLSIQTVEILFMQGELVVINDSKADSLLGKKIIISDVIPVMQGLPLKTIEASEFAAELAQIALGEDKVQLGIAK